MGRPRRVDVAGYCYHLLNRAVGRQMIFKQEGDFEAFESVLAEAEDLKVSDTIIDELGRSR